MKVLILTYGTRGDVQPFVALARALIASGHDAILCGPSHSAFLAQPYEIGLVKLHDTWNDLNGDRGLCEALENNFRGVQGMRSAIRMRTAVRPMLTRVLDDMTIAAAEYGPDVVVSQPTIPGHEIAEMLQIPFVAVGLQPVWVPTKSFPNPMPFVPRRLPRPLNRASYLVTPLWIRFLHGNTAKWRKENLGLPRRRGHHNALILPSGQPATTLYAFSRHLVAPGTEYPDWVVTTGFWFLPSPRDWAPSCGLGEFLAAGETPVYIGFGSMVGVDPIKTGKIVLAAIRKVGVRAVIVGGYGGIEIDDTAEDAHFIKQAPFDWLFPRMAAVVHHGASGTTGAALAAGRPQVVCPFAYEQPFNAHRMYQLGLAPAPVPQGKLTSDTLAGAIYGAVSNRSYRARAAELKSKVEREGGAETAVKVLESLR